MWGPPAQLAPLLGGGIPTLAVPGGPGDSLSQNWGHCLCTGPGSHCLSPSLNLRAILGCPGRELGAPATMEVGLRIPGRLRISQAELDGWVNGEQGEGSGFSQDRWAAWVWGEAFGLSWVLQLLLPDPGNKSCLMGDTQAARGRVGKGHWHRLQVQPLDPADIVIFPLLPWEVRNPTSQGCCKFYDL